MTALIFTVEERYRVNVEHLSLAVLSYISKIKEVNIKQK